MAIEARDGKPGATRPGGPGTVAGMLTLDELRREVEQGTIDTVVAAFTDMQGRLVGKRIQGEYFLEDVVEHGIEGCDYLLALDMEMDPVPGYEMANWESGYGDFRIVPIFPELRPYLLEAFEQAEVGAEYVIARYRTTNINLRTQLNRIISRAGER